MTLFEARLLQLVGIIAGSLIKIAGSNGCISIDSHQEAINDVNMVLNEAEHYARRAKNEN